MSKLIAPALIAAALATGCSHAPTHVSLGASDFFGKSRVHRYRLKNGLKVMILEDHSAPTFAYQTWYDVGSRDEERGLTGLAHLFEHMMFKATKSTKDGEFFRALERAGAEGENAFTSHDFTTYVQSLPAERLDLIAGLEADRMTNLVVDDGALDREREVVQNERRYRTENNPNGKLHERLHELAFTRHSYHWPVIGYEADLRNARREQCEAFYRRFYAPNNATVVIVGDVMPSETIALIERHYGPLKASKIGRPTPTREPPQTAERSESLPIKAAVGKLVIGYHAPDINNLDIPAFEVLAHVLAGGKSSRLYRSLVDAGIAADVEYDTPDNREPGLFVIFANLQKGRSPTQALAALDREIKSIAAGRVGESEIERAVAMSRFGLFDGLASNSAKAHFLGFYETVAGRFERGVDIVNGLRSIDKRALAHVARNYLSRDNRTVVVGRPGAGP